MRLVLPTHWTAQPWRNGGGVTHEVAREGSADAFLWRVSVAEVRVDGPFSLFPGVDRVITLLEGAGFTLRHGFTPSSADGIQVTLSTPGEPFAFPGEEEILCTLVDGPVRDLNLMVDRGRARLSCTRERLAPSEHVFVPRGLLLIFVLEGLLETVAGLAPRHALLVGDEAVRVTATAPVELLVAHVEPAEG